MRALLRTVASLAYYPACLYLGFFSDAAPTENVLAILGATMLYSLALFVLDDELI